MLHYKISLIGILIILTSLFTACKEKAEVTLDQNSVNIGSVGKDWPKKFKLTTAEDTVLKKYGRPDYFRIRWVKDGSFQNMMQVNHIMSFKKIANIKKSWIYEKIGKEIIFTDEDKYEEIPITEQLKLIMEYGDPESVKKFTDKAGILKETWSYYSLGKDYIFYNGHLSETFEYPAMGMMIEK